MFLFFSLCIICLIFPQSYDAHNHISTGYSGYQLVSLLLRHTSAKIEFLSSLSYSGEFYPDIFPALKNNMDIKCINIQEVFDLIPQIDVLFLAIPHGKSFEIVNLSLKSNVIVIDLGPDYRLKDYKEYKYWYELDHRNTNLLKKSVYGLPELKRKHIRDAMLIANPGCYPTATILGLAPILKENLGDINSIVIDGKSGITGAGRSLSISSHFPEINESVKAYKIGNHRHTPEIEQELSEISGQKTLIQFTPHLLPMNRGILISSYIKSNCYVSQDYLENLYKHFYKNEYFIRIKSEIPETRFVSASNYCDIAVKYDKRTKNIIIISAIDNLMKGAASQAIQNMNIKFGINEYEGINMLPHDL